MCPGRIITTTQNKTAPSPPLKPAFDILDADHDGKISSNDLRSFYTSFSNSSDENMIDSMIRVADLDKNGFVEYEEFENVVLKVGERKNRGGALVEEMFKAMDGDGDGKVGFEDLKRWFGLMRMEVSDDEILEMVGGGGGGGGVSCDGLRKILGFEAEED